MKAERRITIVREIEHWQRNKVLPEQYCEFLLNLYADPEIAPKSKQSNHIFGKAVLTVSNATGKQWFLTFGIITLISFVVLYFSSFHPAMQIGLILLSTILLLWSGQKLRKHSNEALGFAATVLGMLLFVGGGFYFISLHELTEWYWNALLIGITSLFWICYGIKMNLQALHLCGWFVFLLFYALLLHKWMSSPEWYEVQLYWLPLSILFFWISWFVHRWTKPIAAVLFFVGMITWFMPEIYTLLFLDVQTWIQIQLLIKFVIGGGVLFFLRKKWMVWIVE